MRAYTIRFALKTKNGTLEGIATISGEIATATNMPVKYQTPKEASEAYRFNRQHYAGFYAAPSGSESTHAWIQGPRGGVYSLETGERAK